MPYGFLDIAATSSVRAVQKLMGSDRLYADAPADRTFDRFTGREIDFIGARDSFYLASVSEHGWPYVQHRGGPSGFLHVLDDRTLAFADYRGNRQYISVGNALANDRVCLLLMDYANQARLKIYAHCDVLSLDSAPALAQKLSAHNSRARIERIIRLRLQAFDWNCPQHITRRFSENEIAQAVEPLLARIQALESELRSRE